MSNVLIGIVGVVLFIGIAIAGALFLGNRFADATSKSDATIVLGQLAQINDAVEMYRTKLGVSRIDCQTVDFLKPRFLKETPVSPTLKAKATELSYMYKPQFNNDMVTDATPTQAAGYESFYITTNLGNDERARNACRAIAERTSNGIQTVSLTPSEKSGCGLFAGEYVAWQRM